MLLLLLVVTLQYNNTMATSTSSQISNFDSSGTTSITLAIEYNYNCSKQHYCHSTCKWYETVATEDRDWSKYMEYISEDQASKYCSVGDKHTFKQTTTLQVLFPSEYSIECTQYHNIIAIDQAMLFQECQCIIMISLAGHVLRKCYYLRTSVWLYR